MSRRYYTTYEVSNFVGVSLPTVVNWIKANRLKAHRTPGGHRRISRDELTSFIRRYAMPMPPELASDGETAKVLVVHTNTEASKLAALVEEAGFVVATATSALDVGIMAAEWKPDLLLTDLGTSAVDAWTIVASLQASAVGSSVAAVALSGTRDEALQKRAKEAGYLGELLPKKPAVELLKAAVENALRSHRVE